MLFAFTPCLYNFYLHSASAIRPFVAFEFFRMKMKEEAKKIFVADLLRKNLTHISEKEKVILPGDEIEGIKAPGAWVMPR